MINDGNHIILVIFILALYLVIGLFPSKSRNQRESFLISDRNLGGLSNGFSIAASKIGGGLIVTYSTLFFAFGISAIWLFLGYTIGYTIFYFFAKNIVSESRKNKYYNIADYFRNKYDKNTGLVIGGLTTLSVFGWILTNLVAGSVLISKLTDWSTLFTVIVLGLIIGAYIISGGFNSVIRTDFIQYLALILIALIFASILNQESFVFSSSSIQNSMPVGQIIGFIILGTLFPLGSAELWQRVYASKGEKEFRNAIFISATSYVVLGVLLSLIGFIVISKGSEEVLSLSDELKLAMGVSEISSQINAGLPAVWLLAYLSAIISSADTFLYTTSSSLVQDLLEKFGIINESDVVRYIRYTTVFLLIISIIIAVIFPNVVSITFFFVGITLIIGSLSAFTKVKYFSYSGWDIIVASLLGVISVIGHFIYVDFSSNIITGISGFGISFIYLLIIGVYQNLIRLKDTWVMKN